MSRTFSMKNRSIEILKLRQLSAGKGPTAIVVDLSGRFVYAANFKSDNITAYRVQESCGELKSQ